MTSFEDHFSKQARAYAQYRPLYPAALFVYLASISPARRLAWDCGTGNGQAAWDLGQFIGFLDSWSATQRYRKEIGQHPVSIIWQELSEIWGEPGQRRTIQWPLYLRVGRVR